MHILLLFRQSSACLDACVQYTYTTQLSSAPLPPTANVMKPRNGPSYFTIKLILNKFGATEKIYARHEAMRLSDYEIPLIGVIISYKECFD